MTTTTFVSTASEISALLSCIKDLPRSLPSLYVDLEGAKLSRTGTISLLTLYALPMDTVYLIDIDSLGAAAFCTAAATTSATATFPDPVSATAAGKQASPTEPVLTLKSVSESPTIPKVFFDVRNDSDALFAHFEIALKCVDHLQLMKLATRSRKPRHHLLGLAWCIKHNNGMSPEARRHSLSVKKQGIKLLCPGKGGSYAVFDERPLQPIVLEHCVQDVMHMPKL
jgi:exonuclease 3'-5' domain-containing protein 1